MSMMNRVSRFLLNGIRIDPNGALSMAARCRRARTAMLAVGGVW